jgi:hypothetical protein
MFGKNFRQYGYFIVTLMFLVSGLSAAVSGEKNIFNLPGAEKHLFFTQKQESSFLDFFFDLIELNVSDEIPSDDDDHHEDDQREFASQNYDQLSGRHLTSSHVRAKFNPSVRYALVLTATPRYTLYCCWKNDLI